MGVGDARGSKDRSREHSRRTCLRVADESRRVEDGPKQGPGDDNQDRGTGKVWEGPPGPAHAAPSLTSAYSALLALILPQTNALRPRDDTTTLHQSTEPEPQAAVAPPPSMGLARGQAPPSSITAQWKPLLLPGGGLPIGANPEWLTAAMPASGGSFS